jgi:glycosyltransferase involved in cell wall biosynthesis
MKILISNKYYYRRGGDCSYTIDLESLLKEKGHDVAIFSMKHDNNMSNKFDRFWPTTTEYSNIKGNLTETLLRPIHSNEVKNKFEELLKEFNPDIIHLNNIHTQLSPVIAKIGYDNEIPVVWTLHDYKLICPAYNCLRDNSNCELCFKDPISVIKHKCIKNSLVGSTIGYLELKKWNYQILQKYTSLFIAPSQFLKGKMVSAGYVDQKIKVLHNFIKTDKIELKPKIKKGYYCYVGRLSKEKGLITLLNAASSLKEFNLKIIGTGPLDKELRGIYQNENIEFLGFREWNELKEILRHAEFLILPSEWYENNPISVLESFALGTPVLGANIGGIPELIKNEKYGLLFESKNEEDLISKINYYYNHLKNKNLGINTIEYANQSFNSNKYYKDLMNIYNSVIEKKINSL